MPGRDRKMQGRRPLGRASGGRLLLRRLDLDQQPDLVRDAHVDAPVHAPLAALDGGLEIAAAHARLEHRLVVAVEPLRLQGNRQRLAEQRELAADAAQRLAVELEAVAGEARLRRLADIEEDRKSTRL